MKLNEFKHKYISLDAWLQIYFQIHKVYFISRVSISTFPEIPGIDQGQLRFPDYCREGHSGNIFSSSETVLMFWMEQIFEYRNDPQQLRIKAFDKDLKTCLVFGALLETYVGSLRPI